MSEEKITLELLNTRILMLTAEVRDLHRRFTAMESRFSAVEARFGAMEVRLDAMEQRFSILEERMSAVLSVIVCATERLDRILDPRSG